MEHKKQNFILTDIIFLAAFFVLLTSSTWRKWGYPWVDFGYEPYAAWQISDGKVLYRDFFFRFGPFSKYFNALLFTLFGASLSTLLYANLLITAFITSILYRFFRKVSGRMSALMCSLAFLILFGFAQYVGNGNYNYIFPYSQEITHGVLFGTAMILCLSQWLERPRGIFLFAAGMFLGLSFLTKPEIALALILPALVTPLFLIRYQGVSGTLWKNIFLIGGASLIPYFAFWIYFSLHMPVREAAQAAAAAFDLGFILSSSKSIFYEQISGWDHPLENIERMLRSFAGLTLVLGTLAGVDYRLRKSSGRLFFYLSLAPGILSIFFFHEIFRALPLWTFCLGILIILRWRRKKDRQSDQTKRLSSLILWWLFSLVLLAKIFLFGRIYHYGFVLAMPAVLFSISCVMDFIPGWMEEKYRGGIFFKACTGRIFFFLFLFSLCQSFLFYTQKTLSIGRGADHLYTFSRDYDRMMKQAMEWVQKHTEPRSTLSVIPEGLALNYLTRRVDPTRYPHILYLAILSQGEEKILEDFKRALPDYILITPLDSSEYGVRYFGEKPGYGKSLVDWIKEEYEPVFRVEEGTGIPKIPPLEIYRHKSVEPSLSYKQKLP